MMRNLFRILLVSSALVAVTAPSAYATPQQEAAAAIGGDIATLTSLITPTSAGFANLSSATAVCDGNKACVLALLTAYAQAGFTPTAAQLTAIAAGANVEFTTAELGQFAIGAVAPAPATTAPADGGATGGTGPETTPPSTGTPGSPS
jgi:hypothetical protein